jgi:hypothetical protein
MAKRNRGSRITGTLHGVAIDPDGDVAEEHLAASPTSMRRLTLLGERRRKCAD